MIATRGARFGVAAAACLLAAGAVAVGLIGCNAEKMPTLKEGFEKYNARQVEESEAIADKIIAANPNAPTVDEAYYLRGLSRMTRNNRVGAAADLKQAITRTQRNDLKSKAWRALGDLAYDQTRWDEAQKNYEQAIAAGGVSPTVSTYVSFRIGASLQAQGDWSRAANWFGRVVAGDVDPSQKELKDRALARMHATGYTLQFGAFIDAARARELVSQLKTGGIAASIIGDAREGQVLYLVQAGAFRTMADATQARDGISAKFPLVTIVP
jgi:tetratricopeptide (TPR) repeat protein